MNIKIQVPQPLDAEKVYEVFKQTWIDTYPNKENNITVEDILSKYPEDKKAETVKKWSKFYENLNSDFDSNSTLVWVAKEEDKVLGLGTIDKTTPIKIGAIYVLPEHQGKGVGKLLMNKLLDFIGNQTIQLNVAKYNNKAIKFYEKFGFENAGDVNDPNGQLPSGKTIPEISMLRKVINL